MGVLLESGDPVGPSIWECVGSKYWGVGSFLEPTTPLVILESHVENVPLAILTVKQ